MWFGLIPGPYRVVRAFTPRRRTYYRDCPQPTQPPLTKHQKRVVAWWYTGLGALAGILITVGNNPTQLPNVPKDVPAPHGWWLNVSTGTITPVGPPVPLGTTVRFIPVGDIQSTWAWFIIGLVLLAAAITAGITLHRTAPWPTRRHNPPPSGPPRPYLPPQPAPLPRPDQPLARSGHKPLNRELPMDRPHPWRTWEG